MKRYLCHRHRSQESGFTLLEALVVLIIVGVLATLVAPSWFRYVSNRRSQAVQTELKQVIQQAQTNARTTRQRQFVEVDEAAAVPTVKVGPEGELRDVFLVKEELEDLPDNIVTLEMSVDGDPGSNEISFNYQGVVDNPFIVRIVNPSTNQTYCVASVSLLGSLQTGRGGECDALEAAI